MLNATEIVTSAQGAIVVERAHANGRREAPLGTTHRNADVTAAAIASAKFAVASVPGVEVAITLVGDADVAIAVSTVVDACDLPVPGVAVTPLRKAFAPFTFNALSVSIATLPLNAGYALPASTMSFDMLAPAARALDIGHALLASAALRDRVLTAPATLSLRLALASAALRLGLTTAGALHLCMTTAVSATMSGLCRRRSGDSHCRNTC